MNTPLQLIKSTVRVMNQLLSDLSTDDYDSMGSMMYNGTIEEYHITLKRTGCGIQLFTNGRGIIQTYTTLSRNMYMDFYSFVYHEGYEFDNIMMKYKGERVLKIPVSKFMVMDDDTKFQYGILYQDFELYHEAYCYMIEKSMRVYMSTEDLEKYQAIMLHEIKRRKR